MPKANLRPVPGSRPFHVFECSLCKTRFEGIGPVDPRIGHAAFEAAFSEPKAALFKEWNAHLYPAHRRQWEFQRAKMEKRGVAKKEAEGENPGSSL
jgi:hypothetical protein